MTAMQTSDWTPPRSARLVGAGIDGAVALAMAIAAAPRAWTAKVDIAALIG